MSIKKLSIAWQEWRAKRGPMYVFCALCGIIYENDLSYLAGPQCPGCGDILYQGYPTPESAQREMEKLRRRPAQENTNASSDN